MRIGIHSYACRTAGEYPACQTIVNNIQPCPKQCRYIALVGARTDSTTRYSHIQRTRSVANFRARALAYFRRLDARNACSSMRRGFCTLVLFIRKVSVVEEMLHVVELFYCWSHYNIIRPWKNLFLAH